MTYLLDSNICIGVLNQQPSLIERLSLILNSEIGIPSVVVGELSFGACKSQDVARSLANDFLIAERYAGYAKRARVFPRSGATMGGMVT